MIRKREIKEIEKIVLTAENTSHGEIEFSFFKKGGFVTIVVNDMFRNRGFRDGENHPLKIHMNKDDLKYILKLIDSEEQ